METTEQHTANKAYIRQANSARRESARALNGLLCWVQFDPEYGLYYMRFDTPAEPRFTPVSLWRRGEQIL